MARLQTRVGHSPSADTAAAFEEVRRAIAQDAMSAVMLFASSHHDLDALGPLVAGAFDVPVLACSTAGELSPLGYATGSLSGVSLASPELRVALTPLDDLAGFGPDVAEHLCRPLRERLAASRLEAPATNAFSLLLVDGLCMAEEKLAANLSAALGGIPLVGGSAGDDLRLRETRVFHDGRFRPGIALLATFFTTLPFRSFKTQHVVPVEGKKVVITECEPAQRLVREMNGRPAAETYARLLGLEVDRLTPEVFSRHPLVLRIGGEEYVRSIQKANPDGSLSFYCAIEDGLVLTLGQGKDLVENLEQTLATLEADLGGVALVIGFECILRRLEVLARRLGTAAGTVMQRHHVVGFHTYGEQYNGIHVNQTLVGVALGG